MRTIFIHKECSYFQCESGAGGVCVTVVEFSIPAFLAGRPLFSLNRGQAGEPWQMSA